MPTTDCSHCGDHVEAVPFNASDTRFDWRCGSCGEPVLLDGDAAEYQRQIAARRTITEEIQNLASELDTPAYQLPSYSVPEFQTRLDEVSVKIERELDRREDD